MIRENATPIHRATLERRSAGSVSRKRQNHEVGRIITRRHSIRRDHDSVSLSIDTARPVCGERLFAVSPIETPAS